jgi:hypothetical protein
LQPPAGFEQCKNNCRYTEKRILKSLCLCGELLLIHFENLNMALPYRLLLICLLLAGIIFSLGPWWAMRSISQAAKVDDKAQWQHLVKPEGFESYAEKMLSGLLDLKMIADSKENPVQAMQEYQGSINAIPKAVHQLTNPKGFSHLLCGDLFSDPEAKPAGTTGCWALDGKVSWVSPMLAKVTFDNPEARWQSSLTLSRVGLFTWQAVDMELPADTLIGRFAKLLGLKADEEQNKGH